MKHYIIDGNNLLGKERLLSQLQKRDKQLSREKLAFMLSRYFGIKRAAVSLHFDGFEKEVIKVSNIKIIYSGNLSADEKIKKEIENSKNPRNIVLVTSDSNLMEFGKVCSCQSIKCEVFAKQLLSLNSYDEEQSRIDSIKDNEEFKILFGANKK